MQTELQHINSQQEGEESDTVNITHWKCLADEGLEIMTRETNMKLGAGHTWRRRKGPHQLEWTLCALCVELGATGLGCFHTL